MSGVGVSAGPPLRPVLGNDRRCLGHLLRTARGWRVFSPEGELLGHARSEREAYQTLLAQGG